MADHNYREDRAVARRREEEDAELEYNDLLSSPWLQEWCDEQDLRNSGCSSPVTTKMTNSTVVGGFGDATDIQEAAYASSDEGILDCFSISDGYAELYKFKPFPEHKLTSARLDNEIFVTALALLRIIVDRWQSVSDAEDQMLAGLRSSVPNLWRAHYKKAYRYRMRELNDVEKAKLIALMYNIASAMRQVSNENAGKVIDDEATRSRFEELLRPLAYNVNWAEQVK